MASGDTLFHITALDLLGVGTIATPDEVEHGTGQIVSVMDFDSGQTEEAMTPHPIAMPGQYDGSSSIDVVIRGSMDSANTGTKQIRLDVKISRLNAGQDLGADGFASIQSVSVTVDNTADNIFSGTVTFTNAQFDGVQPNEGFLLHIQRDHDQADDDATGDFQLLEIEGQVA